MPKERFSTRMERWERQRRHYFKGQTRRRHRQMKAMDKALKKSNVNESTKEGICKRCRPVLTRHVDDFTKLTHRGLALKR